MVSKDKAQEISPEKIIESFVSIRTNGKRQLNSWIEKYEAYLPHEELLRKLLKPEGDRKHIIRVVKCMDCILKNDFDSILGVRPEQRGQVGEITIRLDDRERTLLLWAALYHDIGKAILRPRHGPEGADLIRDSGRIDRKKFYDLGFTRSDFLLISDIVRFHDYPAMIWSGETTYLTFIEVLCPITNNSLKENVIKFLDYLLIMNLADVAGSIDGKIVTEQFAAMMEDFRIIKTAHEDISKTIYREIFKKEPPNDIDQVHQDTIAVRQQGDIVPELHGVSENTGGERLRRLIRAGFLRLRPELSKKGKTGELDDYVKELITKAYEKEPYLNEFDNWFIRLYGENTNDVVPVIASLRGLNVQKDFYTRFAFICKLDYALGFIGELIQQIIEIELEKFERLKEFYSKYTELTCGKDEVREALNIKSPHDLRQDIAMSVTELIVILVAVFGKFTLDDTRIGLGFERFGMAALKVKFLRRLSGEYGSFKRAEALAKFRCSIDMWVITP